ncbi:hypothetical protein M378DRAFT_17648 [Amanita muscaria Koide BX008]|uniref:Uncharacterized protein n=1 Tax=Amanita muscaria (strain Koide BX008) TaxID=946122 RepID=A0A0C2WGK8_AMAMK|nr:hypothetical protein M378DRAFT_17648 [Amanita muscaria Koide BX008]
MSSDLHQLLSDTLRFISKFYAGINRSALHTYHSALPFTPTSSLLYRRYIKEPQHNICLIEGGPEKWDALLAHLNHGGRGVDFIKFSLDSTLFISCSELFRNDPGKLKIWDTAMGNPISTILGDRFAFTNDFSTIASSSDNIITYYNMDGSTRSTVTTSSKIQHTSDIIRASDSARSRPRLLDTADTQSDYERLIIDRSNTWRKAAADYADESPRVFGDYAMAITIIPHSPTFITHSPTIFPD